MSETVKPKKIAVINGILHGHFTGSVEVVRELEALGGIVKKCAVEENPKSEIDRYQAA
ncbi:MAG: hypothetical protein KBA55_14800 [Ruminococcus sp.]|nr:hypothetical protein [Ruminococcus sp.]